MLTRDEIAHLTLSQRQELERRLASFDQDRVEAVSWDALKAELAKRVP
jgi:putative addiction module component (TIGR02574 family)